MLTPTTLNDSFEFEEGDECGNPSELDLSITIDFEHHEIEESEETILQRQCEETLEPSRLEFSNDILSIEYEYFSCGFDVNVDLDVDLCAEYESFPFDPIRIDLLFENCKYKFVESENIATKKFALDQTCAHIGLNRLMHFAPTILPR